jgi:hypothetical protein
MTAEVSHLLGSYLKLLYSPVFTDQFFATKQTAHCENFLKPFINRERLRAEQHARFRNFIFHIRMSLTLLDDILTTEELESITLSYLDSADFWDFRGRSLIENFCLFAYKNLNIDNKPITADLIKLQGIVAGLMADCEKSSPWEGGIVTVNQQIAKESFFSKFKLVSDSGQVITRVEAQEDSPQVFFSTSFEVVVTIESTRKVQISCQQQL